MLRVVQNRSASSAKSYYSHSDYLSEGQELTGYWGGKAAERLGLRGNVESKAFEMMCDNINPSTDERLTARTRGDRTVGYDFNFHVPKGVSIAYGLGEDERIVGVLRDSVEATMQEIEQEAKTRVRKHGLDEERVTGNLAWATFVHTTARPINGVPDPHLHAHAFVFNSTWDEKEDAWKAGQFRDLKRDASYFEAAFHARLAHGMRELGYDIKREGNSWDIAAIPKSLKDKFSRRTDQLEKLAEKLGLTDPDQKSELAAKSREKKSSGLTMPELRDLWRTRLTSDEQWAIADAKRAFDNAREIKPNLEAEVEAMRWAKLHSFERHSVIPEKQLLAEALRQGVGNVTVEGVNRQLEDQKVIVRRFEGREFATTVEMLMEEKAMIDHAMRGRDSATPLNPSWTITRNWLNDDQKNAVKHVLNRPDNIIMIRGGAGTGKTSLLKEAIEGIEATGLKVHTFAPSAEASRGVLASEGFKATTVAELVDSTNLQNEIRGNVIWIDEAGQLGTRTLKRVLDIAREGDTRVILSGDWRQHGSVQAGAAMRILEEEAKLKPALVRTIERQTGEYKRTVGLLAAGKTQEGMEALDRLGWVKEIPDDKERFDTIAKDFADGVTSGQTILAIAPTHTEGDQLTNSIRSLLKEREFIGKDEKQFEQLRPMHLTEAEKQDTQRLEQGDIVVFHKTFKSHKRGERKDIESGLPTDLKKSAKHFEVYERHALSLAKGDAIRITGNGKTKDQKHRLNNGSIYTIKSFTKEGDIKLNNGWVVPKDYGFLASGYVTTSYAAQGKTVDRVLIAESSMSFRAAGKEQFYVSVSRGRQKATVYTDDKEALSDAVGKSDPRVSATELLAHSSKERQIKHLQAKELENRRNQQQTLKERERTYG